MRRKKHSITPINKLFLGEKVTIIKTGKKEKRTK
jgi:hypothetical protein